MNRGLIAAAQSMANSELRVSSIAANLANASTPGYKRVQTAQSRFEVPGVDGRSPRTAIVSRSETAYAQGLIRPTGRNLDLALKGDGFFVLDSPDGELLTRNGVFLIDDQGTLVSEQGFAVAWEQRSGLLEHALPLVVNQEGLVIQDKREIGRLAVRAYRDNALLVPNGNGQFTAPRGAQEIAPDALVMQGSLESSNAVAVEQLVDMIAAQRAYERSAKVIQTISQNYQRLTRPF